MSVTPFLVEMFQVTSLPQPCSGGHAAALDKQQTGIPPFDLSQEIFQYASASKLIRRGQPMESQQVITLTFLRDDGKQETTKLYRHTLAQARNFAESVFRKGDALYVEVEISTETGYSETLSNLQPTLADLQRI
jgi:hypothetical protein